MNLAVAPLDEQGNPIEAQIETYIFLRDGVAAQPAAPQSNPLAGNPTGQKAGSPLAQSADIFSGDYRGQTFNLSLSKTQTAYSGAIIMNG